MNDTPALPRPPDAARIAITPTLALDPREVQIEFVRASGPGGQNVNKVATAAQLRFDVRGSASLPAAVRARLERLAGGALTADGVLVIDARRYRTQPQNRQDALDRLVALVRRAATPPKPRRATRVPSAVKEQRLEAKRRAARRKQLRGRVRADE
ncbi:MAG: aminoacyl-tRNA hydrolase [Anaerolineales bacterium]|nr:aminoacyl-tRNA hydrolase [Anaerolineales bacterium]